MAIEVHLPDDVDAPDVHELTLDEIYDELVGLCELGLPPGVALIDALRGDVERVELLLEYWPKRDERLTHRAADAIYESEEAHASLGAIQEDYEHLVQLVVDVERGIRDMDDLLLVARRVVS